LAVCSYVYEPSSVVTGVISYLEEQRNSLIDLQERHGVKVWHIMLLFISVVFPIVVFSLLSDLFIPLHIDTLRNRCPVCWDG
jgi:hypothetical protein